MNDSNVRAIFQMMNKAGINKTKFAQSIGMVPSTFYNKMNEMQVLYYFSEDEVEKIYLGLQLIAEEIIRFLPGSNKLRNIN